MFGFQNKDQKMLNKFITIEQIQLTDEIINWEDAIKLAAVPLIENQSITESYIQAMIQTVKELGPYIIITPHVALPHARPEKGAQKVALSLLQVSNGVIFSDDPEHNVYLVIVLSAIDNSSHIELLTGLADLLESQERVMQLSKAIDAKEILDVINQF